MATKDGSRSPENSEAMLSTARSVIRTCLQVRREEDVLVITDPDTADVGQALYEEASRVTDRILLVMMPPTQKTGKEPPLPVSDIMRKNRVIIIATKDSMTHTRARAAATREGARIVSMPGIGSIAFESGGMTADYNALQKEISGLNYWTGSPMVFSSGMNIQQKNGVKLFVPGWNLRTILRISVPSIGLNWSISGKESWRHEPG